TFYSFAFTGTVLATGLTLLETPSAQAVTFYTNFADFDAATTTTLVEDFEAVFPKSTNLPSFVSNGNTYTGITSTGSAFPNVNVVPAGATGFGVPVTTSSVLTASGDEDFRVDFGTPAEAVAFDTYLNVFGPATVRVFGASGLLDTLSLTHDPTTVGFLGMTSTELITAIQWTSPNGSITDTGIDNIRLGDIIDSEPVPEPTSILSLLVLGTLGGRSLLKRRSQG
ncbi:MAG: PEP-CTERM sorting domain-containing protein, partial [Cyanobacteria bacterium P01_E01_bin.42]